MSGTITGISGPLVIAAGLSGAGVSDLVLVGGQRLAGEILNIDGDRAFIQVYEDIEGLKPGDAVETTGEPLSVELGPGLLESLYDGLQRPLSELREITGHTVARGVGVSALNRSRLWEFVPCVQVGDRVSHGDVVGTVQENAALKHSIMVPSGIGGTVMSVKGGKYTVEQVVCLVRGDDGAEHRLTLMQRWPARIGRPYVKKHAPCVPLNSGLCAIDTLFPLARGGTAAVTGSFGTGKTVIQHTLCKWLDVDVVVFIGCGERGNEITELFSSLSQLEDPRSGAPLIERTVVIANTSDMPVAAREAGVCAGVTIAEYFRDMGYDALVVVDSISRWAEGLREISGRLGEMPGEEGYPAYLSSRIARFYERAGVVECLGGKGRQGSVTAVGSVSLPGGDSAGPVAQAVGRAVRVLWELDPELPRVRYFPAVGTPASYSLYADALRPWYDEKLGGNYMRNREAAIDMLRKEEVLLETVRREGSGELSGGDILTLETAKSLRGELLRQNAPEGADFILSYNRQAMLLELILAHDKLCREALEKGVSIDALRGASVRGRLSRVKSAPPEEYAEACRETAEEVMSQIWELSAGGGES